MCHGELVIRGQLGEDLTFSAWGQMSLLAEITQGPWLSKFNSFNNLRISMEISICLEIYICAFCKNKDHCCCAYRKIARIKFCLQNEEGCR